MEVMSSASIMPHESSVLSVLYFYPLHLSWYGFRCLDCVVSCNSAVPVLNMKSFRNHVPLPLGRLSPTPWRSPRTFTSAARTSLSLRHDAAYGPLEVNLLVPWLKGLSLSWYSNLQLLSVKVFLLTFPLLGSLVTYRCS